MLTELLNTNYPNSHAIYTDGYVANNTVGCGIYSNTTKCAIKLPNFTSIFSAEAIAISLAADHATIAGQHNIILTDSASVLKTLETSLQSERNARSKPKGTSKNFKISAINEPAQ